MMVVSLSPSPEAPEQQDLPPPGVGEDFRLRRRLCKSWEKYGVGFFPRRSRLPKGEDETTLEAAKGP